MSDDVKTVTVEALQPHTAFGHAYDIGDRYEIDEAFVDTVVVQGKAKRVDSHTPAPASHD
jgi:hypothetical protein